MTILTTSFMAKAIRAASPTSRDSDTNKKPETPDKDHTKPAAADVDKSDAETPLLGQKKLSESQLQSILYKINLI